MRPGQNKRSRGRNGGPHHNNNRPRPPHRSQTFDSNGPSVKIRGNAYQVFERYVALAREAQSSGDRVAAENLYQHAEHYFRIVNAQGDGQGQGQPRPMTPADYEMGGPGEGEMREGEDGVQEMHETHEMHDMREAHEAHVQPVQRHQEPEQPMPPGDDQPPSY